MKMKRILAVLLVFTAGLGLFAQELKFDGYLNSGLGVASTSADTGTGPNPYITAFGVDSWQPGYRFRLNGSYTNEAGTAGARLRFQSQAKTLSAGTPATDLGLSFSIPYAYGWVKFFENVLTLSAGIVDDGTWATGGALIARAGDDQGEGVGALVKITPIAGLDIGLGAYVIGTKGGGDNQVLTRSLASQEELTDARYTFNLGFTLPDLFKITATLRTENDSNRTPPAGSRQSTRGIVGVRILAVPGLTALVEGELDKLQNFSDTGTISIYETLGYKLGIIGVGLNAAQHISQATDTDPGFEFAPWVDFALGTFVPRLDLVYFLGGKRGFSTTAPENYNRINFGPNYDGDTDVISARPSVKIVIDPKTFVEVGDVVYLENNFTGSDARPTNPWVLSNVFYVDFKWSF
jgi:hypothetical protein